MKKRVKPIWSEERRAAGERMKEAWEAFSSTADGEPPDPSLPRTPEERDIADVRARHEAELLRYPNVAGVADGIRVRRGRPTGEPCIVVYVGRKVPRSKMKESERLPREIEGVPVDVVEVGGVQPLGG